MSVFRIFSILLMSAVLALPVAMAEEMQMKPVMNKTNIMQESSMQGGSIQRGSMQGESIQRGSMQGGSMQGGSMQGGSMQGGSMQGGSMQGGDAPANARSSDYSDGYEYRHMAGWEDTDEIVFGKLIADQMEHRSNNHGSNSLRWDVQGWRGTDYNKLWMKFEGDHELSTRVGSLELQTLYSHAVSAFWDVQIGARYDQSYGVGANNHRIFAVLGLQGLAPYWFDLEPALFVSDKGDVSARMTGTYDLLFTQRLILQPRLEINVALADVPQFGVGKGVNDMQLGLRLRYEITREFAPYVGIAQQQKFGTTANLARTAGVAVNNVSLMAGLRWWF